ncbi:MAG: endo,4-beta-xylanase precursor [Flavipsychrobacter sp.]|jgi:uncharacterized protein YjdB|nr:endo,4-beta-xylanase precursor [Flavipsychrobacter sp.]
MKKSFYLSSLLLIGSLLFSMKASATVPTVTSNPMHDTVCAPGHALFIIAAIDTPGPTPITYSWQVSTDGGTVWTTITDTTYYVGTGNDTLDVTGRTMLNGYMYRGIATNTSGADTSTGAMLTVDTLYAGAITGPSRVCRGATITLASSVSGGTWTSSTPSVATVGSSTGVVTGMPTAFGYDTIMYSAINTCGTDTSWVLVHVDSAVTAASIVGPSLTCVGNFITLTNANTVGSFTWSSSNTSVATVSGSGVVTGVGYGTAVISYAFTNACSSVMSSMTVAVDTVLSAGTISGGSALCAGSWTFLSPSVGGGIWFSSNSAVAVVVGGTVTGVSEGSATISYIVSNGCGSSVATHAMTVSRTASMITGLDSVGIGLVRALGDSAAGGVWSIADTNIAIIDSVGNVTGRDTGTVMVTYTVTNTCGTSSATLLMHVGPAPSAGAITGPDSLCLGAAPITLSNPSVPGGVWHIDDSISMSRASITGSGVVSGLGYGPANISYTFTNGFGSRTIVKAIFVNRAPVVTVTGPAETIKKGANYLIRGVPYSDNGVWTSSNSSVALLMAKLDSFKLVSYGSVIVMGPGSSTLTYTVTNSCGVGSGTYVLTLTVVNGVNTIAKNQEAINIFPNPNSGAFTFNLAAEQDEQAKVVITNILGEKVKEMTVSTNKPYHVMCDVPAGLYMLTATTANGTYSGKVTITE